MVVDAEDVIGSPCRVLVIEDHEVTRYGLGLLIETAPDLVVAETVATCAQAQQVLRERPIDLVVLDLTLPDCDGFSLIASIRKRIPATAVVVFSMHDELTFGERAINAGASGYVTKHAAPEVLIQALRTVAQGELFMSEALRERLAAAGSRPDADDGTPSPPRVLSNRELQVLNLLGSGMSTAEIAAHLRRSVKTIEAHRENIKAKLGLRHANELMRYAVRWVEEGARVGE